MTFRHIGKDPDYRYSLANERTYLAWVRTALAILAGAILIKDFAGRFFMQSQATAISVFLAMFAGYLGVFAYRRWRANEIAIRLGKPLPKSPLVVVVSTTIVFLGLILLIILLF